MANSHTRQVQKTNTLAILALVFGFLFPLLGIIFGAVSLGQIKSSGEEGRGLATAGIVIGAVFILVGIIFAIVVTVLAVDNVDTRYLR